MLSGTQHVREAFEHLQPIIAALVQAYAEQLDQHHFTWGAFLWVSVRRFGHSGDPSAAIVFAWSVLLHLDAYFEHFELQAVQFWNSYSMQVGSCFIAQHSASAPCVLPSAAQMTHAGCRSATRKAARPLPARLSCHLPAC